MQVLGINILGILLHVATLANAQNVEDTQNVGRGYINLDDQYIHGEEIHTHHQYNHERIKRTMAEQPPFLRNTPLSHASAPSSLLTSSSSSRSKSPPTTTNSRNPAFSELLAQLLGSAEDGGGSPPERVSPERLALSSSSLSLSSSISSAPSLPGVACAYCVRRPRHDTIGHDTNGDEIQLDVGTCRKRIRKKLRSHDSSRHRCSTCGSSYMCVPSNSRMERAHLPTGSSEHRVIVNCTCQERSPPRCVRRPHVVTFSPNSRYETSIDVGTCEGGCPGESGNFGCKPVTNKTVAFRDPNGARTVETIKDCACTSECFRATHMESIYARKWNSTANQTQVMSVDLDVGKCVGTCPPSEHCVIPGERGTCMMALTVPSTSCHAKSRQEHTFILPNGGRHSIYSITDCSCPSSDKT